MVETPGFEPGSKISPLSGHSQAYLDYSQTSKVSRKTNHPYRESGPHLPWVGKPLWIFFYSVRSTTYPIFTNKVIGNPAITQLVRNRTQHCRWQLKLVTLSIHVLRLDACTHKLSYLVETISSPLFNYVVFLSFSALIVDLTKSDAALLRTLRPFLARTPAEAFPLAFL